MKDMSVKELIVKCGVGWNDFKAELLRRFEELEKENKEWRYKWNGCVIENEDLALKVLNLECCGNCDVYGLCKHYNRVLANSYCSDWQSDGLTREEREGK